MLLPIQWLKKYVDIKEDSKTIADRLSDSGSHVESIENRSEGLSKVVVGKIESIESHPDADKLVICHINIGKETVQIVTGASNVFEGAFVPVALVGARLADGLKIKKSTLRGVDSYGMLCSLEELGFNTSVIPREARDGIYIFQEGPVLGSDALEALNLYDDVFELEITPNRPDCLSMIGMAIETAATFDLDINYPKTGISEEVDDIEEYVQGIEIKTDRCRRYYARVLKDVRIEPSPQWLQNHLMAAGVRPVSNIVDLTNFVMLEYGQPLHAFDLDELSDQCITVRQAEKNEVLKTLDGIERSLNEEDILICDGKKGIALGGVMGGFNSEIKDDTRIVLLEGANFNEESIRKTSKRLNLRSEASSRFEKGLDPNRAKDAIERVCQLAETLGMAQVVKGSIDVYPKVREPKTILLRREKCNQLMGVSLSLEEMAHILNRLEIKTEIQGDQLEATIPTFRLDLNIEEDLIEEIARIYGFDNIRPQSLKGYLTIGGRPKFRNVFDRIRKVLLGFGYSEYMTYSFVSPSSFDKLLISEDDPLRKTVNILNPLGEDYSVMRTTLIPEMIDSLAKNYARGNENVAGFELGNTFTPSSSELPKEHLKLCLGFYDIGDFYYLKESIEKALWSVGIKDIVIKRGSRTYLHPGRSGEIYYRDQVIGVLGEVHPTVSKNYGLKKRAYIAEIDFYKIVEDTIENYLYEDLAKYPSMKRDLAFVLDRDVDASDLEAISMEEGSQLLESFKVFDIYEGENIDTGKKSVAFSLVFRAKDRTLEEQEITILVKNIIERIEKELQGELRS
ncbi:MAG: phenylalanine--tRNA ligase subunit beta [Tissierellia bacterium]|nr:phenylalanine--tRNA ligase subunit beta [Tissierellia bacterium]